MRIVWPTGLAVALPNRSSTTVVPNTATIAVLSLSAVVMKRPSETVVLRTVPYASVTPLMLVEVVLPP